MNSSYGKNGLKETRTKMHYFDGKEEFEAYRRNHAARIIEATDYGTNFTVKVEVPTYKHRNRCQVSSMILSMSKRIMNEVICLAESMDIPVYYQDTDSIFVMRSDLTIIRDRFEVIYKRPLVGGDMGQFHCDFNLPTAKDPCSEFSIFIGKKFHAHQVVGYNDLGEKVSKCHLRSKGIPESCITKLSEMCKIDVPGHPEYSSALGLMYKLYKGEPIYFDIAQKSGPTIRTSGINNRSIRTMPRKAYFPKVPENILDEDGKIRKTEKEETS